MAFLSSFPFDFYRTLRFATRLPLPVLARENDDPIVPPDRFAPAFVACGAVVAAIGGLFVLLLSMLGASPLIAALLGTAAMIIGTGALHEDGLADCADGLGGGRTRDRKLEIMRDSAIGTYGVLALILTVGGRVAALAALVTVSPWLAVAALMATQTASRAASMGVASILDHARPDGASARLGRPSKQAALMALGIAVALGLAALFAAMGPGVALASLIVMLTVMAVLGIAAARLAQRHIGGQTGDILGAVQQLTDLAGLLTLYISVTAVI